MLIEEKILSNTTNCITINIKVANLFAMITFPECPKITLVPKPRSNVTKYPKAKVWITAFSK